MLQLWPIHNTNQHSPGLTVPQRPLPVLAQPLAFQARNLWKEASNNSKKPLEDQQHSLEECGSGRHLNLLLWSSQRPWEGPRGLFLTMTNPGCWTPRDGKAKMLFVGTKVV